VDRLKELIKCKGFCKGASGDRATSSWGHPDILDAAVIGEPHAAQGEVPVAYARHVTGQRYRRGRHRIMRLQEWQSHKTAVEVVFTDAIPQSVG
jgi:acyl-coenzyme A synthetase/AMP-(fatty) acid ligase